ncbi:MAG: hypothetical protein L6V87_08970 [Ruminococcus sp.]|nr:MAG: hypothetical protein L6V87_08970 [Ruminococcus sp.]
MNNGKQNKLVPMLKAPVTFAENVGALVCSCTELAVKYAAAFICGAGRYVKKYHCTSRKQHCTSDKNSFIKGFLLRRKAQRGYSRKAFII